MSVVMISYHGTFDREGAAVTAQNIEVVDLLRKTTVKIVDQSGEVRGTGFFIARGLILTAAHVVDALEGRVAYVSWNDSTARPARVLMLEPSACPLGIDIYPMPDL